MVAIFFFSRIRRASRNGTLAHAEFTGDLYLEETLTGEDLLADNPFNDDLGNFM